MIARAPRIAAPGETLAGSSFTTAPGGKGANQALAARRAGAQVALFGVVGRDAFAPAALALLTAAGVEMGGVAAVDGATGVALITVDDHGENAITVIAGANALARAESVPDAVLTPATTLLLQMEVPLPEVEALALRAHRRGARVILNAAPAASLPDTLLEHLTLLIVNEHEAAVLAAGWSLPADPALFIAALRSRFGLDAVVTIGARGALLYAAPLSRRIAPPVVAVVDTTGAGDALVGAMAAALDRGAVSERALQEGVAAGAIACTRHGAQAALPDAASIAAACAAVQSTPHSPVID